MAVFLDVQPECTFNSTSPSATIAFPACQISKTYPVSEGDVVVLWGLQGVENEPRMRRTYL
jgi:hypothetical protein